MSSFYLTTAIDYVNSRPHLGTAYEKVTADVIARYRRLCGVSTHFLMGNDEHSQNVYQRAMELGLEPRAFCDQMEQVFREVWAKLDVSFDDFIRTTEDRHRLAVTTLVQRIADAGDLYEGEYEGWYCVSCEAFKPDKDLVDGECSIHQTRPEWIKEKNHFFRLSKYRDPLLQHYEAHPMFLKPDVRRNEMLRLLEGGLEDISVSRTGQSWGIPLPFDATSVVYVWFDALINYISAVGYGTNEEVWGLDLGTINSATRLYGLQLGGWNKIGEVIGLQVGLANSTTSAYGFQLGGWNYIEQITGLQNGLFNSASAVSGLQLGGGNTAAEVLGLQLGGVNEAREVLGLQLSFWNIAEKINGLQLGLLTPGVGLGLLPSLWNEAGQTTGQMGVRNVADHAYFFQIGAVNTATAAAYGFQISPIYNRARELYGIQIGLINVVTRSLNGLQIGLLNISRGSGGLTYAPLINLGF